MEAYSWLELMFALQRDGLPVAVLHVVEQHCTSVRQRLVGGEERTNYQKKFSKTGKVV